MQGPADSSCLKSWACDAKKAWELVNGDPLCLSLDNVLQTKGTAACVSAGCCPGPEHGFRRQLGKQCSPGGLEVEEELRERVLSPSISYQGIEAWTQEMTESRRRVEAT